jgi:ketosteroid isomerase-like protein
VEGFAHMELFGIAEWELTEVDFIGGKTCASQSGNMVAKNKDGQAFLFGKFTTVYKRYGSRWLVYCDFSNLDHHDIKDEMRERFAVWNKMFLSGDIEAMVKEFYTEDAKVMVPGHPMQKGHEGIISIFKSVASPDVLRTELVLGDVEQLTDDAWVDMGGQFVVKDKTGAPTERGSYVVVWKRVNGKLCIQTDIMNPMSQK